MGNELNKNNANEEGGVDMKALLEEELDSVVGGFREGNRALSTAGLNIICPSCEASDSGSFSPQVMQDAKTGSVEYKCKCGCQFVVYEGNVIPKAKWVKLCRSKNYSYPFA